MLSLPLGKDGVRLTESQVVHVPVACIQQGRLGVRGRSGTEREDELAGSDAHKAHYTR